MNLKSLSRALVLTTAVLLLAAPAAQADPDGYQPQLQASTGAARHPDSVAGRPTVGPDLIERFLVSHPDGYQPQLQASTGAARHPDSLAGRVSLREARIGANGDVSPVTASGIEWTQVSIGVAAGLALAALAGAALATRARRGLAHS
jgi:hypothetical protein